MTRDELDKIVNEAREKGERPDLRGAILSGADLRWAILSGADLRWANLSGAILSEADGSFSVFYGGQHHAWAAGGRAGIGCHTHSIEHWQVNYREIGEENGYTEAEIERYGAWIMTLDWLKLPKDGEA